MCTGACDSIAAILVAVDQNVTQIIVQAKLQETVTGACDCPSVLVVVAHDQTMGFCAVTETAVVVGTSSGAVLDAVYEAVIMYHLM